MLMMIDNYDSFTDTAHAIMRAVELTESGLKAG